MKKPIFWIAAILLVLFVQSSAFAQRFGIKAGLNLANVAYDPEPEEDFKMLPTFNVGGLAEFDFSENMGLGVGLQIAGKGAKLEQSGAEIKFNPIYLQVPVNVFYRNNGFYAGVGPYIGFGLFGQYSFEFMGDKETEDIEFGNDLDDDFAPIDFGLGFEVGYHVIAPLRISVSYDLGLMNVVPQDYQDIDDGSIKNNVLGINLAWFFTDVE
ncbi:MAG: PorT family protein [Saprospiraceae bacterium]|nr:PorT family protein [Saprospiraceae bacterium]